MELKQIWGFLQLLPEEIKNHIISYTYSPQSLKLMEDVQNYVSSKNMVQTLYYNRWHDTFVYEEQADHNWLYNDLIGYMNEGQATIFGYRRRFHDILSRNYSINLNIKLYRKFLRRQFAECIKQTNNLLWGLLKVEERNEFLESQLEIEYRLNI